jgi:hypothetical protein
VCILPLRELGLAGSDVHLLSLQGNVSNLRELRLYNDENTPTICQVLLSQLHHLRAFVLNHEQGGSIPIANKTRFEGAIASRELRTVNLEDCTVPSDLIPGIPDVSKHLWCFLLPKNVSDNDVQALGKLRLVEMLRSPRCVALPTPFLLIISQHYFPRLHTLTCQWIHLPTLSSDVLFRLAKACPLLKRIGFEDYENAMVEKRVFREGRKAL